MNSFKNRQTSVRSKSLLAVAFLGWFSVLSVNFLTANAQTYATSGAWKLKEIKVFNNMEGNLGHVVKQRYDEKGGEVEINISGSGALCPGGSEAARFAWRFVDDASQLINGGGLGISLEAGQKSSSRPCTTELSSRSFIWATGGALFLTDYPQSEISRMDGDRFKGRGESVRAFAAGDGARSVSSGVTVSASETSPNKPLAVFEIDITTPTKSGGGHLRYAYVYELAGSISGVNTAANNPAAESAATPQALSSPSPAGTQNASTPTMIGPSGSNGTSTNSSTSSKGNKGGCLGLIILIVALASVAAKPGKRN